MLEIGIDQNFVNRLEEYRRKVGDFKSPLTDIGLYLERTTKRRFDTETDPNGVPWKPLSISTLSRKKKGLNILTDGGLLKASVEVRVSSDSVTILSPMEYAIYHQTGTKNKDKSPRMPARPFIGASTKDIQNILGILSDYLDFG